MRGFFYIVILLVVTGCSLSTPGRHELDRARTLMSTDPSAALSTLNQIDVSTLGDSADVARWALLYSEALVANKITAPTDTIVDIAIDYYSRHSRPDELRHASRLKALLRQEGDSDALATALYLQKEKEFFLYRERARHRLYLAAFIIICVVAVSVIAWMRQRMKFQIAKNDALMAEASGLRCEIDSTRGDLTRLETKLHGILENRFALIDSLCQTYYESQGTKTERKAVVDKVRSEIEAVRADSLTVMERAVNDCRDNMLAKVLAACPTIKDDDYRLLVYLAAGLSTRTLCLLLGESVDVVYKRKSRLKSRLRDTVAPVCPEIMGVF
ncbi:MAG: hypothetical protein HDR82_05815 [Bacteroides sp.]|nr:hypothetical protein [Bacteroides sp.]